MQRKNVNIRNEILKNNLKYWQVAYKLRIK